MAVIFGFLIRQIKGVQHIWRWAMKKNVGSADRAIRIVAGLIVIFIGINFKTWWGAIGVLPIITAALGWCPAYLPFGINSCKEK
jgi:hypothetical protein